MFTTGTPNQVTIRAGRLSNDRSKLAAAGEGGAIGKKEDVVVSTQLPTIHAGHATGDDKNRGAPNPYSSLIRLRGSAVN
jgi:hypothetical protein